MTYMCLGILSQASTLRPGCLDLTLARRDGTLRVAWVMPAGQAWHDGVRPGMQVVSLNGRPAGSSGEIPPLTLFEAQVLDPHGQILRASVVLGLIVRAPLKWSLWLLGGAFTLCGSVVALRRPDLAAARAFLLFCASAAFALTVSPSAGGPHARWALIVMFASVVGIGATLPAFVLALDGADRRRYAVRPHVAVAVLLTAWYAAAVILSPRTYSVLRVSVAVYVVLSIAGSIAVLGTLAVRNRFTRHGQQARIILFGVLVGALPFVALSFAPELLGRGAVAPARLTVLATAFIPASAAFAVAHSQFLEIRRLIHRGMVYALTTTILFVAVVLLASVVTPVLQSRSTPQGANLLIGVLVALGVGLFYPLRLGIRQLVDRFLYEDVADPQRLIEALRDDVVASTRADDFEAWIDRLASTLHVESVLLFGAATSARRHVVAAVGPRAPESFDSLGPEIEGLAKQAEGKDLLELRWGAEALLIAPLRVEERDVGHLILGPKEGGEVFVAAEKQLVGAVAPVLAVALHKSELSDQLRLLNQRLVDAEEAERARLASDVHDGPLQKAILLGGLVDSQGDRQELARELVRDLREVCSRLRPAILDDLGLVPALEWLLEGAAKRFPVVVQLRLQGLDEADRFPSATELALFRITQEAISNAVKHGKPTTIDVSLIGEEQTLILRVDDDGAGFVSDLLASGGLGLPGIRGRAGQLGGTVNIRSTPGFGTSVVVRVPLDRRPLEQQ